MSPEEKVALIQFSLREQNWRLGTNIQTHIFLQFFGGLRRLERIYVCICGVYVVKYSVYKNAQKHSAFAAVPKKKNGRSIFFVDFFLLS